MKEMILALGAYFERFKLAVKDEKGQGLVEYALILVLISVVAIATMTPLGTKVAAVFTSVGAKLP